MLSLMNEARRDLLSVLLTLFCLLVVLGGVVFRTGQDEEQARVASQRQLEQGTPPAPKAETGQMLRRRGRK
jgi:hypothetical protein